jgi:hypothetical protein
MISDSPSLQSIRTPFTAALIIAAAFVLAFCTTVFLLLMFPREQVRETGRSRLAAENQAVRMEHNSVRVVSANLIQKRSGD